VPTLIRVSPRIALATSADHAELHPHDLTLADALRAAGLHPVAEVWTDPSVDWSSYDAVLLRTVWDYHVRYLEFTEWLGQLDKAGVPVLNDTDLVRWNADKQYLLELRERGVSIVPSQVAAGPCLRDVINGLNGQQVVIKPTVSATAHLTIRGTAGSEELSRAIDDLPDTVYLVQPFQPEIQSEGEWSLIFIDGEFTHAVLKRPADGDYRVQDDFGGTAELLEAPAAVLEGAAAALAAADTRRSPVYARVDGIVANGRFLLMELELIEPYLFLPQSPEATTKLATAVADRLS
jgi:glutathione synthase/RimK-type ligase-like ATP-grasp enzyme